jgi:predicted DNA-binding transcriptional regulator AlpA
MLDPKALRLKMFSRACSVKELASVLEISKTALYRRINGKVYFTVPEVAACTKHLGLTLAERDQIFFT